MSVDHAHLRLSPETLAGIDRPPVVIVKEPDSDRRRKAQREAGRVT